jgi:fucose permease
MVIKSKSKLPPPYPEETFWHNSIADRVPNGLKFGYECVCLVAGATIVVVVADVTTAAENCGLSTSVSSYLFIVEALGTLLGGVLSSWLLERYHGNRVIAYTCLVGAAFIIILPFLTNAFLLFVFYFISGGVTNLLFTNAFFMLRATLAYHAGPWLGLGQVFYGIGGVTLTAIEVFVYYTMSSCSICDTGQYMVLSLCYLALFGHFRYVARDPQKEPSLMIEDYQMDKPEFVNKDDPFRQRARESESDLQRFNEEYPTLDNANDDESDDASVVTRMEASVPHYRVEFFLCMAMVLLAGGLFTVMAYLTTYVEDLDLESYDEGYAQVTVGYAFSVIGVVLGFLDQAYFVKNHHDLLVRMLVCCFLGGAVMLLPVIFPDSLTVLWFSTTAYMFFNGPTYGYAYDWMNRLTYTTDRGTAIVTFGVNAPAFVVVAVIGIWYTGGVGPVTLMYCGVVTMWLTIPCLWIGQYQSYRRDVKAIDLSSDRRGSYEAIPDHDEPIEDTL